MFQVIRDWKWILTHTKVCIIKKVCVQSLVGFKVLLVDDPKATWKRDAKMVDIIQMNMY